MATTTVLAGELEGAAWLDVVGRNGGRVVDSPTHGVVALFDSASAALAAAIAGQQAAVSEGRRSSNARPRVGAHIGDTTRRVTAGDFSAIDSVIRTARSYAEHAAPGEIMTSDLVRALVGDQFDLVDAGTIEIDSQLVQAWRVPTPLPLASPVRVVIAEDSVLIRTGIVTLLTEEGFDVVAEVGDADTLLDAARTLRPDLVVTDVRMPPTQRDEGIVAAAALRAESPTIAVLVLSQHVEPAAAALLLSNNPTAVGYLLKERVSLIDEFLDACRSVASGEVVIDPLVTERLMASAKADDALSRLTEREREVLELMAQGRSNTAIARAVHCAPKTLEAHVRSIFMKLDMRENPDEHRRVAAVVKWLHGSRHG